MSLIFTTILIVALIYVYIELQLPSVATLKDVTLQVPLRVYTADQKLIAEYGGKRRIPVKLNEIPKLLIDAVLATEDSRFYEHPGVDFIGLIRAAKVVALSGKRSQGASTITMQVARNFFLSSQKTYSRKINEILLALKIDRELSKDKILELYLNKIYFGNRAYGVAAAADVYYGKNLSQLTLPEMAMIAGLPQAPSRNNPIDSPESSMIRRDHVLKRMYELGYISQSQFSQAITAPNTASFHATPFQATAPYVAEMVRESMVAQYGLNAYDKGLVVYTTISSTMQAEATRALQDGLIAYDKRHGYRKPTENLGDYQPAVWQQTLKKIPVIDNLIPGAVISVAERSIEVLLSTGEKVTVPWSGLSFARPALNDGYVGRLPRVAGEIVRVGDVIRIEKNATEGIRLAQLPEAEGALIAMNPQNGAVLALVGGFDYGRSNFNRATQAERQPGSSFKPFIYSAALDKGFTLASVINDAPIVMRDTGENALWRPMNDSQKFYGPTTLRVALTQSRNLVSIRLLQAIGISYAINYIKRFGFEANVLPHSLSLALGSGVLTPMQLANGYAVFANGGYQVTPYFIERIEDQHQNIIYQAKPLVACQACITNPDLPKEQLPSAMAPRIITPQNAYLITQALRDVIRSGTGRAARVMNRSDLAGKTGTTNSEADAWFAGFNQNLATTVWVGFDNLKSLKEHGAQAALPIWIQFMTDALKGTPESAMAEPPGIVMVRINPKTGALAGPDQKDAKFEVFNKAYQPKQQVAPTPDTSTNATANANTNLNAPEQPQPPSGDAEDQQIF